MLYEEKRKCKQNHKKKTIKKEKLQKKWNLYINYNYHSEVTKKQNYKTC